MRRRPTPQMAERGLRILAVAVGSTSTEQGATLIGLIGIADPPRTEAIEAVAAARWRPSPDGARDRTGSRHCPPLDQRRYGWIARAGTRRRPARGGRPPAASPSTRRSDAGSSRVAVHHFDRSLQAAATLGVFVWALNARYVAEARNLAFSVLVFGELFRAFAARSARPLFWEVGVFTKRATRSVQTRTPGAARG